MLLTPAATSADVRAASEQRAFMLPADENTETCATKLRVTIADSLLLDNNTAIDGLAISGMVVQSKNSSFVRVLLEDKDGTEYVVLETNRLFNDMDTLIVANYCEETKYLPNVYPTKLRVFATDATIEITQVVTLPAKTRTRSLQARQNSLATSSRLEQVRSTVDRINANNKANKRLWRAATTEVALQPWETRKRLLGIDDGVSSMGFEYYASGIFEMGEASAAQTRTTTTSPYVDNFDWRNRHGVNWMTPVKHQSTGNGCWAFTAVGVTEALVNLYYNQKIDYDLSEQEVISCSGWGSNAIGGNSGGALRWIASHGVSEESAFPFSNSDETCENKGTFVEQISMDTGRVMTTTGNDVFDDVKRTLIQYGPLAWSYFFNYSTGHATPLVGYGTLHVGDTIRYFPGFNQTPINFDVIEEGDTRIGNTYWIFKDSYGTDFYYEHNGYAYIMFNGTSCLTTPYYAEMPIHSLVYTDSDVAVTDNDGDGYYYWGIGNKPAHCPAWVPDTPDGDDSNYAMGPMDEYGYLFDIEAHVNDIETLSSSTSWVQKKYIYHNIIIPRGVILTITNDVVFYNGAKITLQGGALHINGGHLYNATIDIVDASESNVTITDGGSIAKAQGVSYEIPIGSKSSIIYGKIR